jgi:hypothetical protein
MALTYAKNLIIAAQSLHILDGKLHEIRYMRWTPRLRRGFPEEI